MRFDLTIHPFYVISPHEGRLTSAAFCPRRTELCWQESSRSSQVPLTVRRPAADQGAVIRGQ